MRNDDRRRKLLLARQTLRVLTEQTLAGAQAGYISPPANCGFSCRNDSYSSEATRACWFDGSENQLPWQVSGLP